MNPKKKKIQTVNVIEMTNGLIDSLISFKDTEKGNKNAEELFTILMKERARKGNFLKEYIGKCLDDGYFKKESYELILFHST